IKWYPPAPGFYKLNTDGSYMEKEGIGGLGGIIRNSAGDWVVGFHVKTLVITHTHAELLALQHRFQLAVQHSLFPIEVETDSVETIELLQKNHITYQSTLDSCRYQLRRLGSPAVRHSFREGNKAAHLLAKQGSKQATCNHLLVMESPPPSVLVVLQAHKGGLTTSRLVPVSVCNKL
ncbi:hypothetical protein A4A49_59281, partial [Nicotiana attenuata]